MTATVRSVDVRLNALVSQYITDMRRAGRETDRAFAASTGNVRDLNRELGTASQRTRALNEDARGMNTTLGRSNTRIRTMATQSKALNSELDGLRGRVRGLNGSGNDSVVSLGRNSQRTSRQLDTVTGRVGLLAEGIAVLGPSAIPLTAQVIPALAGVATQLGFGVAAAGAAVIAFHGVGDALKALDKARLAPTKQNLEAAQNAMDELGPAGQRLVKHLYSLRSEWQRVRAITQKGLFPGVDAGLDALDNRVPQVERILFQLSSALGRAIESGSKELASPEWDDFFTFLETEARPTLDGLAKATGNVAHGAAQMWMAFAPLEHDWTDWLVRGTESFDTWATRLSKTQGFANFVAYVREQGPQVGETLLAWGNAFVQISEAAAPLGGPVLHGLEDVADILAAIADSDLGTPIFTGLAAMALLSRATKVWGVVAASSSAEFVGGLAKGEIGVQTLTGKLSVLSTRSKTTLRGIASDASIVGTTMVTAGARSERELSRSAASASRLRENLVPIGKGAALVGGLALATSGVADGFGLSNTASLALAGTIAGPWGAAAGGAIGLTMGLAAANNNLEDAVKAANVAMESGSTANMRDNLKALDEQIDSTQKSATRMHDILVAVPVAGTYLSHFADGRAEGDQKSAKAKRDEERAALDAAAAEERYSEATMSAGRVNKITAGEIRGAMQAMEEQRTEALAAFDAVTQYGQAMENAREAAAKGSRGLNENTKGGRENREALSQLVAAWNLQGDAVANNVGKYREARKNLMTLAAQMGASRTEARQLAAALDLPKAIATRYMFYDAPARSAVARIMAELRTIPKNLRTNYYVNQINSVNTRSKGGIGGSGGRDGDPSTPQADGGSVPKDSGGYFDKYLYKLAPGEEIISNRYGQADQFRADRAAGRIPGYADGGTTGRPKVTAAQRRYASEERQIRTAVGNLDIGTGTVRETRREIDTFVKAIHRAGGHLAKDFDELSRHTIKLSIQYNKADKALDDARSRRADIRAGAVGAFNNDIFSGSLSDLRTQLSADTNDANSVKKALRIAGAHGLKGDLAAGLAASGNVDLAKQFQTASPDTIRALVRAFGGRATAQAGLGAAAVKASGADAAVHDAAAAVKHLITLLHGMDARLGAAVYHGAFDGAAQKQHQTNQRTANRSRTR